MSMMTKSHPADARISIVSRVGNLTNMPSRREPGSCSRSLKCEPMMHPPVCAQSKSGRGAGGRRGLAAPPELLAGERGTFSQRLQLGPLHLRMHPDHAPALGEPAVRAGDDVLSPDHTGVILDPPRHQLRVLDDVRLMAHDARDQDLP